MASEPTVACIMLTKDRHELAARAVRCFRAQTYENKKLWIFDTGDHGMPNGALTSNFYVWTCELYRGRMTIGRCRNEMILESRGDVIIHWDDDDYSHPNRIAEQVAFLQSSGAAVVGYNQMLFWNHGSPDRMQTSGGYMVTKAEPFEVGESWLYTGPAHQPLGTSLCYWRSTWESHRFDDRKHAGEDSDFLARVGHRRVKSVSSVFSCKEFVSVSPKPYKTLVERLCEANATDLAPRMIATVHGANTQQKTYDGFFKGGTVEMKRVAEWDERVRVTMEGA